MKYRSIAILIFCMSQAATASAQTFCEEIGGGGTSDSIAMFTGRCKVGNSNIFQSPTTGNIGIGNTNPDSTLSVFNFSNSLTAGLEPYAINAVLFNSTINFSAAIRGDALASSGGVGGVIGLSYSHDGWGVNGVSVNPEGGGYGVLGSSVATSGSGGGGGVLGTTSMTTAFSTGVRGSASGTSGPAVGVFGESFSPDGIGGSFVNRAGGTILSGNTGGPNLFRVDSTGRVFADGGFQPSGADFAESMLVAGDRTKYAVGDLLVIDSTANSRLALSQQPYSTLVAGIYSTKPGLLGTNRKVDESTPQNEIPLAVVGIVPCKVTAENGPIQVGDLLVTSSTAGHAMKGTDRSKMLGAVVGKALEPLAEGKGVIQVLVTLQ